MQTSSAITISICRYLEKEQQQSELPRTRELEIGNIGTGSSSLNCCFQMEPQLWIKCLKLLQGGINGALDIDAGSFNVGSVTPIVPTHPNRMAQLLR